MRKSINCAISYQDSKTDREATSKATTELLEHGKSLFPKLFPTSEPLTFVGLRPSCQFRDYQIKVDRRRRIATAGAIRRIILIYTHFPTLL